MGYQKREQERLKGLALLVVIIFAILCWPLTLTLLGIWLMVALFGLFL